MIDYGSVADNPCREIYTESIGIKYFVKDGMHHVTLTKKGKDVLNEVLTKEQFDSKYTIIRAEDL